MNASALKHRILNSPGYKTKKKYVIIQSDDWGSIRMPSNEIRKSLSKYKGLSVDDLYSHYDTLCTPNDLDALFDTLQKFRDTEGNHPIITANAVMANPDFTKMKADNYQNYFKEPITKTFDRYDLNNSLNLWKEGEQNGLFDFQYHGQEHVNVPFWLIALQEGPKTVRDAANYKVFAANFDDLNLRKKNFQAAWDFNTPEQEAIILKLVQDGLQDFKKFFQKDSLSVIAPSYTWSDSIENLLINLGVQDMQGMMFRKIPVIGRKKYKRKWIWTKKANAKKMGYQIRNIFFEPTLFNQKNQVEPSLFRMEQAFRAGKPAIIGSHRINFSGSLDESNRTNSLQQLEHFLKEALRRWPDIQFISCSSFAKLKNKELN